MVGAILGLYGLGFWGLGFRMGGFPKIRDTV